MKFFALLFSLYLTLVAAQTTRTVTSTLTSTWVSTCTVLYASASAPAQPSAGFATYPLTNGTVATTTPVPTAQPSNPSGTVGVNPSSTKTPYSGAAASAPQALFALAAGLVVLISTA